jgi:hypothetical protein
LFFRSKDEFGAYTQQRRGSRAQRTGAERLGATGEWKKFDDSLLRETRSKSTMAASPDMSPESLQRHIETAVGSGVLYPADGCLPRLADIIEDWIWSAHQCEAAAALLSHVLRLTNCEALFLYVLSSGTAVEIADWIELLHAADPTVRDFGSRMIAHTVQVCTEAHMSIQFTLNSTHTPMHVGTMINLVDHVSPACEIELYDDSEDAGDAIDAAYNALQYKVNKRTRPTLKRKRTWYEFEPVSNKCAMMM